MMIPSHSVSLQHSDYVPYLRTRIQKQLYADMDIASVMHPIIAETHVVPTPTGRHALWYYLALKDYPKGSEVLIAAYNYFVIVRLVIQMGLKPVFVDIEEDTLCLEPDDLLKKITGKSRLIIVTHTFGHPADMKRINQIALEHSLHIFEDCAHGMGSHIDETSIGLFGDGALFSFGVKKIVTCFGGGALVLPNCRDRDYTVPRHEVSFLASSFDTFSRFMAEVISTPEFFQFTAIPLLKLAHALAFWGFPALRNVIDPSKNDSTWTFNVKTRSQFKPFMLKMLQNQVTRLDSNIFRRREIIFTLKSAYSKIPEIKLLNEDAHGQSNGSYFGFYCSDKSSLSKYLFSKNIGNDPQQLLDCSRLEQFSDYKQDCERSRRASDTIIRLPSYPTIRKSQIDHIANTVCEFYS